MLKNTSSENASTIVVNKRACHDRRVEAYALCQHRQRGARYLGKNDRHEQGERYGERNGQCYAVDKDEFCKSDGGERDAAKHGYSEFLPDYA